MRVRFLVEIFSESDSSDETVLLSELIFDLKAFDANRNAHEIIFFESTNKCVSMRFYYKRK